MAYNLFLFDLDDTLLDFKESEKLSFYSTLKSLNIDTALDPIFESYQQENRALWKLFEEGKTSKDHLKIERFRKTFNLHKIDVNPELASTRYLDMLPETVVLIDYAVEICTWLKDKGEIGIVTNGIHHTQTQRIKKSQIAPFISFTAVSEECGYAKPDVRFFEYSSKMVKNFSKSSTIVIGDRLETDVLGAHNYGLDACWFNPLKLINTTEYKPKYEIAHLSEIEDILR